MGVVLTSCFFGPPNITVTLDAIAALCVLQGWKEGGYLDCAQYCEGGTENKKVEWRRKGESKDNTNENSGRSQKIKIVDQRVGS